jgi:wobble nucleotide-excising tRNase
MLSNIRIANLATYSASGETFDVLKSINFVFGANGAGKTTISRVIANPNEYPGCNLVWQNNLNLETFVYNRDFVERNYRPQLSGIFTLGRNEGDIFDRINAAKEQVENLQASIAGLQTTLGPDDGTSGKRGELKKLRSEFEAKCWELKIRYDDVFKEAFAGYRNSQSRFCDKLLSEFEGNNSALLGLDELTSKSATVFDKGLARIEKIPAIHFEKLLKIEVVTVLSKRVVGKEDVDVSRLVERLGNSDWVRQGLRYLDAGKECPFCQQNVAADLARRLNDYFDETFRGHLREIEEAAASYKEHGADVIQRLEAILEASNRYINSQQLRADIDRLSARVAANNLLLEKKRMEPSSLVALDSLDALAKSLAQLIDKANSDVDVHNVLVDNQSNERSALVGEIWKFLIQDGAVWIADFVRSRSALESAERGLTSGISAKVTQLSRARGDLAALERSITSVAPTVTAINQILTSFGFTGFTLRAAGDRDQFYEVVRDDGNPAIHSLSEGERGFVTFLYFYHLLRGSFSESGVTSDRIVVFDDPVSSMDSDVLFVVSSLIKKVLKEASEGTGQIKQVFVLTHNIYFHKEVSFDPKRDRTSRAHETFWTVRKNGGQSKLERHTNNPIKTSYELMWQEIRNPSRSNTVIQNTMRRILESYFKILGNFDTDDIVGLFDGQDQQICASLFSWVNDGSHNTLDDLFVSLDSGMIERYQTVFREIFVKSKHEAHYDMMMRSPIESEAG